LKILVIQTAFIGDVILATPILVRLIEKYPDAQIDILVRKGNEGLLANFRGLNKIIIWNKRENKIKNLFKTIHEIRLQKYDQVINIQRFLSTGLITLFSKGKVRIGFDKNPLSMFYTTKVKHEIESGTLHEVQRNLLLLAEKSDLKTVRPKLFPSENDFLKVKEFKDDSYFCLAPTSVWFTKQLPPEKWIELISTLNVSNNNKIYLLGAPSDFEACERIRISSKSDVVVNLAGKLHFLETAALMKDASMNYVNDSAPMHIASAMNAPVTVFYCSTVKEFGFGPLSDSSRILEISEKLECRPCGLHGYAACPKGHFNCGHMIQIDSSILQ
jgi:lipopolysaccharide heptosyltransferase II